MPHLTETEHWVYRKKDQSLVGLLIVTELEDDFMDMNVVACSGKLVHAQTDELERLHMGGYDLVRPGREEFFGDYGRPEEVCEVVKNHVDGPYFLEKEPILPEVD